MILHDDAAGLHSLLIWRKPECNGSWRCCCLSYFYITSRPITPQHALRYNMPAEKAIRITTSHNTLLCMVSITASCSNHSATPQNCHPRSGTRSHSTEVPLAYFPAVCSRCLCVSGHRSISTFQSTIRVISKHTRKQYGWS